jgi:hypothetical protein
VNIIASSAAAVRLALVVLWSHLVPILEMLVVIAISGRRPFCLLSVKSMQPAPFVACQQLQRQQD